MSPNVWVFVIAKEHLDACTFFFVSFLIHVFGTDTVLGLVALDNSRINSLMGMGRYLTEI